MNLIFFFQAEDGIRDIGVTGVQTCALPISRSEGRAALIAYLPVGYPDVDASIAAMVAAVEGGADVVEVGVPYSDPGMDGPVIQQAADPAVRAGVGMRGVLRAVEADARTRAVPVVIRCWTPVERDGDDPLPAP